MSAERFASLLNRLGRKNWHVYLSARYAHGEGVSRYLARYVKGGPLHNSQIVRATEREVTFRYHPPHRGHPGARHRNLEPAARTLPQPPARARPRAAPTYRALLRPVRPRP